MRKVVINTTFDRVTFEPVLTVNMKEEGGEPFTLMRKPLATTPPATMMVYRGEKYTVKEYEQIELCNKALLDNGHLELTTEEAKFMLTRTNYRDTLSKLPEEVEATDLQALAGFKVEKVITTL